VTGGDDTEHIPLLSGRPLEDFTPGEFKEHIKGLYRKRPAKAKGTKLVKRLKEYKVSVRLLKSGKISILTQRPLKYVTEAEMIGICAEMKRPENEIFLLLKEKGIAIYYDHDEAEKIHRALKEIPF
jgi:hypothetical protein